MDADAATSWIPVSATGRNVLVKGCISTRPAATRRTQIFSLGIQHVRNNDDANVLYETVNDVFANSSFGMVNGEADAAGRPSGPSIKPRKGLERWPMFYLHITLSTSAATDTESLIRQPRGPLADILALLKVLCHDFLRRQHMRPGAIKARVKPKAPPIISKSSAPSSLALAVPNPARKSAAERARPSPFDDWQHVKIGWPAPRSKAPDRVGDAGQQEPNGEPLWTHEARLVGERGKLLRTPFIPLQEAHCPCSPKTVSQPGSLMPRQEDEASSVIVPGSQGSFSGAAAPEEQRDEAARLDGDDRRPPPSHWLRGILESWKNPVVETTQARIPSLQDKGSAAIPGHRSNDGDGDMDIGFDTKSISLVGRLSRYALAQAQVIAQVDCKFVLVKLPLRAGPHGEAGSSIGLVMIDQHAADERCRLEELMASYFRESPDTGTVSPVTERLEEALVFETSSHEGEIFGQYQEHFAAWGLVYEIERVRVVGSK